MTTRHFLRIAAMALLFAVTAIFASADAAAQCTCRNTITVDPNSPCCIRALDVFVECDAPPGTITQFDPGAGPFDSYCRGTTTVVPCPCMNTVDGVYINDGTGSLIYIPVGMSQDIRYQGDCCLRITVTRNPSGCLDINVGPAPMC